MISGKKIAIYGLGIEGLSAARFFTKNNKVCVLEDKSEKTVDSSYLKTAKEIDLRIYFGRQEFPSSFDLIIRSPGVRPDKQFIKKAILKGAELTSPTSIFMEECKGQIIGITGTKGKGTTSTLIYEFLRTQYKDVHLAGNIGKPMLDLLPKITKETKIVLELSSFQLMDTKKSPHVAVILMVTSEHLDWHKDLSEYLEAKRNIVKYQGKTDFAVVNADFENSLGLASQTKAEIIMFSIRKQVAGVYLDGENFVSGVGQKEVVCKNTDVTLAGAHNFQNVAAAISVAKIYKISNNNIKKVLGRFKGLEYRLQHVATKIGVEYYNDSFSTTPETTIAAIEAFTNPKILILGGSSKNSNFIDLIKTIRKPNSIKAIIFIGEEGKRIKGLLGSGKNEFEEITGLTTMSEIVKKAAQIATKGDVVLLSPACASFGLFKNYKDRGDQFTKAVKAL